MDTPLTADTRAEIDRWLAKYPPQQRQSAVLAALHAAQRQNGGWLTPELVGAVAEYLGMPRIAVEEVVTFYSMYETRPVGRHMVSVCTNISCWLRGALGLVAHVERKLGIRVGETTPDGRITLKKEEECLAACCGAPMMVVDGHYYENLTPERVDAILDSLP